MEKEISQKQKEEMAILRARCTLQEVYLILENANKILERVKKWKK